MNQKKEKIKYRLLHVRTEEYDKFEKILTDLRELNTKVYSVELFKLILNFWIFHNEEDLKKNLEEARRIKENIEKINND